VIVVEVVFAWPGLGRLVYNAVAARDYPVIQGAVLLIAVIFLLINLVVIVLVAITADWIAPYGVNDVDVASALQSPRGTHWFGTDELGRDILSRVMVATQASLQIAVAAVAFAFVAGVTIGVVSGYMGGWTDTVLMRAVDVMFAFPVLLLALAIVA